ncbi:MAG: ATP-binding cassette domain-containing protein, partial [Chloroflexota bacterium]|nr:ATP-binding cassette domain-containing protein [Chloroflexota bacterium]
MSVLSVQAVARWFGAREVLKDVSFRIAHGDRVGLVGPNGTGKTSLLRIAAGLDTPDRGAVAYARGTRVGFLRQELLEEATGTVIEHARGAAAHLRELERELRGLEGLIATGDPELLERYADAQHHFEHAGGYDFEGTLARILGGLGLGGLVDREVATLSGGERTRLGLARLLLDDPDVLLLDEPTNHLDVAALEWLENFLVEQDATCLISSHDRWFLDRVTSRTLSIEDLTVVEYRGVYSHYARQRLERETAQMRAHARQAEEIAKTEDFIRRYGAGQRSKEARGRGKKLARVEHIEAPMQSTRHSWGLEAADLGSETVLETTALAVGYSEPVMRTGPLRVARDAR